MVLILFVLFQKPEISIYIVLYFLYIKLFLAVKSSFLFIQICCKTMVLVRINLFQTGYITIFATILTKVQFKYNNCILVQNDCCQI